jgi:hypothetical protein
LTCLHCLDELSSPQCAKVAFYCSFVSK